MTEIGEHPGAPEPPPVWFLRLAAGVEAAVPAALAVLLWFGVHSRLAGEPWWSKFNVAAAPFFGDRVYYLGLGRATLCGAALLLLMYCALGILYGFLAGGRTTARAFLRAALWLTCWHYFSQQYVWPRLDPDAAPYFPVSATVPAHAAAAILLARLPAAFRRLSAMAHGGDSGDAAPPEPEAAGAPDCAGGAETRQEGEAPSSPSAPDC